jgi:hypothetical protein
MTLSEIYKWIEDNFSYYKSNPSGWKVSPCLIRWALFPSPPRSSLSFFGVPFSDSSADVDIAVPFVEPSVCPSLHLLLETYRPCIS